MELLKIKKLYQHVSDFHREEVLNSVELNLEGKLIPTLRNYQEKAVKWMLKKELITQTVNVNDGEIVLPNGGILADEMGLGKTVEVLACVLSNACSFEEPELRKVVTKKRSEIVETSEEESEYDDDDYDDEPRKKRCKKMKGRDNRTSILRSLTKEERYNTRKESFKYEKGELYNFLKRHYESAMSKMSCVNGGDNSSLLSSNSAENNIRCFCDQNMSNNKKLVMCERCGVWQHSVCLGIENGYSFGEVKCPQCWSKSNIIDAKATLIITPASILNQWIQEIEKHVNSTDFKYIVYTGVKGHNYIQPPTLAGYDVVLTTYNVLCSELVFVQSESPRSLRHAKKYYSPTSPLVCLRWWRICLDEAQMVEGYTSKTAIMASQLPSHLRWAVTGTPIQKSINDLYGLLVFLRVEGLKTEWDWDEIGADPSVLYPLLQELMWRSNKADVRSELGVPPQTILTHWQHFSPVEGHFYRTIHSECAAAFRHKLRWFADLDIKVKDIDKKVLSNLMQPLLGVRQACTHPQVVRGKFVRFKHTMTMEELMGQMILKAKKDADGALRQLVASIHGIAAIHIILFEWKEAAEKYREVLHLNKQYEKSVKIDTLQMIHCLHNLAEILDGHGAEIPPTIRDTSLREDAEMLERSYLEKYDRKLVQTRDTLTKMSAAVVNLSKSHTLSYTGWWEKVIMDYDLDDDDLVSRITTYLDDNIVPGQTNISKKLTSLQAVHRELALWLANSDMYRQETMDSMRNLEIHPKGELIEAAFLCHINRDRKKRNSLKKRGTCPICHTEGLLKKYEAQIFSVNKMVNDAEDSEEEEDEGGVKGKDKKEEKDGKEVKEGKEEKELKEVNIYLTNKEGSWKPTSQEMIIHVLASVAKRVSSQLAEEGAQHLALMESVRKEFKWIRAVWRNISDQVYATDELYMAKLRLRLPMYEGETTKSDIFIIAGHDVPYTLLQLKTDYTESESTLRRTTGTLFYLQNLQKSGTTEQDCPVCKEPLTNKWSVLMCGHCCCYDCIPTLLKMSGNMIDCPLCRLRTPQDNVSYVQTQKTDTEENLPKIVGDHSTKVTAVLTELLSLLSADPAVKVLIFSTWEKVLDIIRDALLQNNISFRRLESGGDKFKTNLSQFKNGNISVLLLPLKHGSKGLNLTEATHLFFVEPILNPAEEQQAVSRIHRIGQTKATWVHRFVVRNTIEERMMTSLEASTSDEWAKENLTLRRLNDLFLLNEESESTPTVNISPT